jgi:F0F1-type ATP synthase assembly protein I
MAGDPSAQPPDPGDGLAGAGQGWLAVGYLISGIVVWGFIGRLVDQWFETGGAGAGIGSVVGAAAGVYLIARRLGAA